MSGWYAVKRGITSHPLFKGRPDRLAVWLWLLDHAAWKATTHDVGGRMVQVARGAVCASERHIAKECGVGHQVVRTFVSRLKIEHMISTEVTQGRSLITICNWDKFQNAGVDINAGPNAAATQDQRIKETREQNTPNGEAALPPSELDILNASVWHRVKPYLASHGIPNPGALIGKWLKLNAPEQVLIAASKAQRSGTEDPVPYITAILKGDSEPEAKGEWSPFGFIPEVG